MFDYSDSIYVDACVNCRLFIAPVGGRHELLLLSDVLADRFIVSSCASQRDARLLWPVSNCGMNFVSFPSSITLS